VAISQVVKSLRLFRSLDDLANTPQAELAQFYELPQRMRELVASGEPRWGSFSDFVEYANVCHWAIRRLEYGFAIEAMLDVERQHAGSLNVLDVGCGVVPLNNWLSARGHAVVAIDPLEADIEFLVKNDLNGIYGSSVRYLAANGEQLPFEDQSFDAVTCVSVLEHIAPGNDRLTLWEIARVLRPGGRLIITFDISPALPQGNGDERPRPYARRGYAQPFSPPAARRLLDQMSPFYDVASNPVPAEFESLTWEDVHAFWRQSQGRDERSEETRDYLAAGLVLGRRAQMPLVSRADVVEAYGEAQAALEERLAFYERHAAERLVVIQGLQVAADERLQLIEDLGRRARAAEAAQTADRPIEVGKEGPSPEPDLPRGLIKAALGKAQDRVLAESEIVRELDRRVWTLETSVPGAPRALEERLHATEERQQHLETAQSELTVELRLRSAQEARQAAETLVLNQQRLIEEQHRALQAYRRLHPAVILREALAPRLGVLYQHVPRRLGIPARYGRVQAPTPAPSISIVTPTLNQSEFLERTIESVLNQGYPRLEYIVQDGLSDDGTSEILQRYSPLLAHVESRRDTGQGNALNLGFAHASGDILAYLNSDDMLLPGSLAYVARFFAKHPKIDVVYGHRVLIDSYDADIGRWVLPRHDDEMLLWADYVPQETLFWRRSIWEKVGAHIDESFRFAMDWDLLLRFREAGARFVRLPRFLGAFRVHPEQKTSAQMEEIGQQEMGRLRERCHGRTVSPAEVGWVVRGYLIRHIACHYAYRLRLRRF
jgi:SAM-dependent methyltransferase